MQHDLALLFVVYSYLFDYRMNNKPAVRTGIVEMCSAAVRGEESAVVSRAHNNGQREVKVKTERTSARAFHAFTLYTPRVVWPALPFIAAVWPSLAADPALSAPCKLSWGTVLLWDIYDVRSAGLSCCVGFIVFSQLSLTMLYCEKQQLGRYCSNDT